MIYYQNIFDLYTCLITCIAISHKNIMGDYECKSLKSPDPD